MVLSAQTPRSTLALWSAPRSRSTAFERMMRARGDFTVLHEPFSHLANYGSTTVDDEVISSERNTSKSSAPTWMGVPAPSR